MSTPTEQQPRTLEEAEAIVELFESLQRLEKNPDFKIVFETHLFINEVIRLHGLLAHPDQAMIDSRDRIIGDLDALSNLKFTLQMIRTIGSSVKIQIEEYITAEAEAREAGEA